MSQSRVQDQDQPKEQQPPKLLQEGISTVITGALIGIVMLPISLVTRRLQLITERRLSHSSTAPETQSTNSLGTKGFQYGGAHAVKESLKALGTASGVGMRKNAVLSQRDPVKEKTKDLFNQKDKRADDVDQPVVDDDFSEQQPKQAQKSGSSIVTEVFIPAIVVTGLDAAIMNPSSNIAAWRYSAMLDSNFKMPEFNTMGQKVNASTAGFTLRFAKGLPYVGGLLAQPYLDQVLPSDLSDGAQKYLKAFIMGGITAPIITALDNLHGFQLSTVKQNGKTDNILKLLSSKKGWKALKPTPGTLVVSFVGQAALQYLVPVVDQFTRTKVTPRIMSKIESPKGPKEPPVVSAESQAKVSQGGFYGSSARAQSAENRLASHEIDKRNESLERAVILGFS